MVRYFHVFSDIDVAIKFGISKTVGFFLMFEHTLFGLLCYIVLFVTWIQVLAATLEAAKRWDSEKNKTKILQGRQISAPRSVFGG